MKLQNIFLAVLAFNQLSVTNELSREEYAALKIQTAFRASQAREEAQDLRFEKFQTQYLNPIPFKEFRDLICSGNYLNRTDLLGSFVQMVRKETVHFPKKLIDSEFQNRFDLKTIQLYQEACFDAFEQRAVQEIQKNKMSWTDAVAMPNPVAETGYMYPVTATCQKCNPPQKHLVLGNIADELADQLLPIVLPILYAKHVQKYPELDYTVGSITIFGQTYATPINVNDSDPLTIKAIINDSLSCFLTDYFKSLGKPAHHKHDDLPDDEINWTQAAQKVFYLGQFFFDNKADALTALGGQIWIKQQPEDIQEIINVHLKSIQPQSWLSRAKNTMNEYANYAKQEVQYYLRK